MIDVKLIRITTGEVSTKWQNLFLVEELVQELVN